MNTKKNANARLNETVVDMTLPENKPFPRQLRNLMDTQNVTQAALGEYLGVTRQTVSYYVNGKVSPTIEQAEAIARFFNVSLSYMLSGHQAPVFHTSEQFQNICKEYGGETYYKICSELFSLTKEGQTKVLDRIEELKELPKYNAEYQEYKANSL